jgi:hypothetical protein
MSRKTEEAFDCLAFKWRVQTRIYEEIKDRSIEDQIAYFRRHVENGPFADLVKRLRQRQSGSLLYTSK